MDEKDRPDLEQLETLRDLALCGPEDKREEAQKAYEELRAKLFIHDQCEVPEENAAVETAVTLPLTDSSNPPK